MRSCSCTNGFCVVTRIAQLIAESCTAKNDYYLDEINPNPVVLVQVLVPLWCLAAINTRYETDVLFLCPRGRPWCVVWPESLPAGSTCRLFRSSWRDIYLS